MARCGIVTFIYIGCDTLARISSTAEDSSYAILLVDQFITIFFINSAGELKNSSDVGAPPNFVAQYQAVYESSKFNKGKLIASPVKSNGTAPSPSVSMCMGILSALTPLLAITIQEIK